MTTQGERSQPAASKRKSARTIITEERIQECTMTG